MQTACLILKTTTEEATMSGACITMWAHDCKLNGMCLGWATWTFHLFLEITRN